MKKSSRFMEGDLLRVHNVDLFGSEIAVPSGVLL